MHRSIKVSSNLKKIEGVKYFKKETKQRKRKKEKGLDKMGLKCYPVKAVTQRRASKNGSEKEKKKSS